MRRARGARGACALLLLEDLGPKSLMSSRRSGVGICPAASCAQSIERKKLGQRRDGNARGDVWAARAGERAEQRGGCERARVDFNGLRSSNPRSQTQIHIPARKTSVRVNEGRVEDAAGGRRQHLHSSRVIRSRACSETWAGKYGILEE